MGLSIKSLHVSLKVCLMIKGLFNGRQCGHPKNYPGEFSSPAASSAQGCCPHGLGCMGVYIHMRFLYIRAFLRAVPHAAGVCLCLKKYDCWKNNGPNLGQKGTNKALTSTNKALTSTNKAPTKHSQALAKH